MEEIRILMEDMEKLRRNLHELIERSTELQDPEVIAASRILDAAIAKYNEILEKRAK